MTLAVLQLLAATLVSIAMALSLAHALELPGKLRLNEQEYRTVQPIYYPGFTYGGAVGELGGGVATAVVLILTPFGDPDFWLTLVALACILGMQAVYWLLTHPVNRFWLEETDLGTAGSRFFGVAEAGGPSRPPHWTQLRDRWEYSHVARAVLSFCAFLALLLTASRLG